MHGKLAVVVRGLALSVALAAACDAGALLGSSGDDDVPRPGITAREDPDTIIVGRPRDASSLDPALVSDNESVEIAEQLYDKLLNFKPGTAEVEPGLATSWTSSEGGRVWTFHLRRGVKFHDGTPLNARAVVFSFERQRDPFHPFHRDDFQYWHNTYQNVVEIEAIDDYTVRIAIDEPYAPFLANMAMFPVAIVSPAAVEKWGDDYGDHPVGTGPFRFASWTKGDRIVLERNPDYWGGAPRSARIVFRAIPDGRQRLIALEGGAIDIAYSILPQELQFVELHPELVLHRTPANNVAYLAMNTTHAPLSDLRVRRAINHAIDKEPIVKLVYQGEAVPANGPLPPTQWAYHELPQPYEADPPRAAALLAEAAQAGAFQPEREITLYVPSDPRPYLPDPIGVARVVRAQLAAVGVNTRLVVQPFADHLEDVQRGVHDICLLGWTGDNGDPDNFLYVLFDSNNTVPGVARNLAFIRDPELHGLLTWAQQSEDRDDREKYYARAQELIHELAPWVPIAHSQVSVAARADITGVVISPMTTLSYRSVARE